MCLCICVGNIIFVIVCPCVSRTPNDESKGNVGTSFEMTGFDCDTLQLAQQDKRVFRTSNTPNDKSFGTVKPLYIIMYICASLHSEYNKAVDTNPLEPYQFSQLFE
jgi:hypothetical protein